MTWGEWFDDLFKARRLTVSARSGEPRDVVVQPEPSMKPTAKPARRLTVPPGGKVPPGGGWTRTPNGWARGQGNAYEWLPLDWESRR